jgi:hypothetical protein
VVECVGCWVGGSREEGPGEKRAAVSYKLRVGA